MYLELPSPEGATPEEGLRMWRLYLISTLIVAPLAVMVTAGALALWRTGQYLWLWWLIPACWLPAWLLARRWRRQLIVPTIVSGQPAEYWTERDEAAWQIVRQAQQEALEVEADRLVDPHFYLQSAMDLGLRLARHYSPKAKDPVGSRTVLEILTVAQLALEDSHRWISDYVPGSHLLTIDQWRMLAKAPRWLGLAGNLGWIASIAANPLNVTRFVASKLTMDSAARQFQDNALAWGYAMYLGRVGFYLIEMNSGRLRVGAARYRELTRSDMLRRSPAGTMPQPDGAPAQAASDTGCEVVVAIVGQVKAGKSSLINALIGRREAEVDALPATREVQRFRMHSTADVADGLTLLDTPGYGEDGATDQQRQAIRKALAQADLVLLVMKVTNPARRADAAVLDDLIAESRGKTDRKAPPIAAVLTHIDQLSPIMEWTPPYDWDKPTRPKEEQIGQAVQYHRELLGDSLAGVVPVCSDVERGREFGVREWLLPAMLDLLGEARGCAVLRVLREEIRRGRVRRVFLQLARAGAAILRGRAPPS